MDQVEAARIAQLMHNRLYEEAIMSLVTEFETDAAKAEATLKSVEAAVKAKVKSFFKAVLARLAYVGVGFGLAVALHFATGVL
jgi:hypothetical protein